MTLARIQVTAPLVKYYEEKGLARTFSGTKSDVIYPQVKKFLESTHFFSWEAFQMTKHSPCVNLESAVLSFKSLRILV